MIFSCIRIVGIYSGLISPLLWVNYQWFAVSAQSLTVRLCGCIGSDQTNCTAFLLTGRKQLLLTSELADEIIRVWGSRRGGMEINRNLMLFLSSCRSLLSGRIWGHFEPHLPPRWQILSISLDFFLFVSFIGWKCKSLFLMNDVSSLKGVFFCILCLLLLKLVGKVYCWENSLLKSGTSTSIGKFAGSWCDQLACTSCKTPAWESFSFSFWTPWVFP